MTHQTITFFCTEHFAFKSYRVEGSTLYFAVTLTTEKSFDSSNYLYSKVHAAIRYIALTTNDVMWMFHDAPYRRVVNDRIEHSTICIERYSGNWSFNGIVEIPSKYQSYGVGRTVFNIILKQAIIMAGDAPFMDKLEPGDAERHKVRDPFYQNIGFIYDGHHFKIDRVDKLTTFDSINNVDEIDLEKDFFEACKKNEELTKALAYAHKNATENDTNNNTIAVKYNRCNAHRFWCVLIVVTLVLIYELLK